MLRRLLLRPLTKTCAALFACSLLVFAVGCSDTVDEIDDKIDCHSVCQRYADCFNSDYDVEGCGDRCENDAEASEAKSRKLEQCSDCIDDRSCSSATFACTDECVGIVP